MKSRFYINGFEYDNTKKLSLFPFSEGIVSVSATGVCTYEYSLKDHLGNTRVIVNASGTPTQTTDYYPFGLSFSNDFSSSTNRYLYNGKEIQTDKNLSWYDYGARFYDPQIGRWHVKDPKSELLESSSPYVYSVNNPVNFIDKDGELPIFINGLVANDYERGSIVYWDLQLLITIANSGIPNPGGEFQYVDGDRGQFLSYEALGHKVDGPIMNSEGLLAQNRIRAGYFW